VRHDGFDLHAGLLVPTGQRERLERILQHRGLPPEIPELCPARASPLPRDAHPAVGVDVTAFDRC